MNLIGIEIKHRKFGIGKVIGLNANQISIEFNNKVCKFVYPDAFGTHIAALDTGLQSIIVATIPNQTPPPKPIPNPIIPSNPIVNTQPGLPNIFFVFQGSSFDIESKYKYLWAPKTNKIGSRIHHWDRLQNVKAGDIILHASNGYIMAISTAKDHCYDFEQPSTSQAAEMWQRSGRRIDCDYIMINRPIRTIDFKDDIIKFNQIRYSPFNKKGAGNMGYFFDINRELAKIFMRSLAKSNKYILENKVITDFINEKV